MQRAAWRSGCAARRRIAEHGGDHLSSQCLGMLLTAYWTGRCSYMCPCARTWVWRLSAAAAAAASAAAAAAAGATCHLQPSPLRPGLLPRVDAGSAASCGCGKGGHCECGVSLSPLPRWGAVIRMPTARRANAQRNYAIGGPRKRAQGAWTAWQPAWTPQASKSACHRTPRHSHSCIPSPKGATAWRAASPVLRGSASLQWTAGGARTLTWHQQSLVVDQQHEFRVWSDGRCVPRRRGACRARRALPDAPAIPAGRPRIERGAAALTAPLHSRDGLLPRLPLGCRLWGQLQPLWGDQPVALWPADARLRPAADLAVWRHNDDGRVRPGAVLAAWLWPFEEHLMRGILADLQRGAAQPFTAPACSGRMPTAMLAVLVSPPRRCHPPCVLQSQPAFGATPAPAFGASPAPAFGAASTPAFGAASAPAFGAGASAFGAKPAFGGFGATAASPFGASSAPAFGASGPAFGAASAPGERHSPCSSCVHARNCGCCLARFRFDATGLLTTGRLHCCSLWRVALWRRHGLRGLGPRLRRHQHARLWRLQLPGVWTDRPDRVWQHDVWGRGAGGG